MDAYEMRKKVYQILLGVQGHYIIYLPLGLFLILFFGATSGREILNGVFPIVFIVITIFQVVGIVLHNLKYPHDLILNYIYVVFPRNRYDCFAYLIYLIIPLSGIAMLFLRPSDILLYYLTILYLVIANFLMGVLVYKQIFVKAGEEEESYEKE